MTESKAITARARGQFDTEQVALIQQTVAKDCTAPELHMFLEIAARYQLDPFAGQIYVVKMPGKNGGSGRVTIITGRDGFLTIANRYEDFEGIEGDVVRQKDNFRRTAEGKVEHVYDGGPDVRGQIVGAWAKVYRKGRKPTYFFAPMSEYGANKQVWKDYPSAMILKCAESVALRKAFSISGLVGEEELAASQRTQETPTETIDYGDDPDLAERLRALFEALNAHEPDLYRPAKIRAKLAGLDHDQRLELARELEDEIVAKGAEMPEPEVVEGEVVVEG